MEVIATVVVGSFLFPHPVQFTLWCFVVSVIYFLNKDKYNHELCNQLK